MIRPFTRYLPSYLILVHAGYAIVAASGTLPAGASTFGPCPTACLRGRAMVIVRNAVGGVLRERKEEEVGSGKGHVGGGRRGNHGWRKASTELFFLIRCPWGRELFMCFLVPVSFTFSARCHQLRHFSGWKGIILAHGCVACQIHQYATSMQDIDFGILDQ